MAWDYAQVEEVLARMYRVPPDVQRKAFRARIQHLQKLGIPLGLKPGKGRKISYTEEEVFQWVLCLELAEYSINPSAITNTIKAYWNSHLLDAFRAARRAPEKSDDVQVCFSPHLVPDRTGRSRESEPQGLGEPKILRRDEALRRAPLKAVRARKVNMFPDSPPANLYFTPHAARSLLLINISEIIRALRHLRFLLAWKPGEPLYPHAPAGVIT
jgi:hypothetical protein